jgi:hypothetical protein
MLTGFLVLAIRGILMLSFYYFGAVCTLQRERLVKSLLLLYGIALLAGLAITMLCSRQHLVLLR